MALDARYDGRDGRLPGKGKFGPKKHHVDAGRSPWTGLRDLSKINTDMLRPWGCPVLEGGRLARFQARAAPPQEWRTKGEVV